MINVDFSGGYDTANAPGLTQWDKGQILRIYGLDLPEIVQVHFSTKPVVNAIVRLAYRNGEYSEVKIPNVFLESAHSIYAYIYVNGGNGSNEGVIGETIKTVVLPITARTIPSDFVSEEDQSVTEAIDELLSRYNHTVIIAENATKQVEEMAAIVDRYRELSDIRILTKAEFEALEMKEDDIVYVFSDDTTLEEIDAAIEVQNAAIEELKAPPVYLHNVTVDIKVRGQNIGTTVIREFEATYTVNIQFFDACGDKYSSLPNFLSEGLEYKTDVKVLTEYVKTTNLSTGTSTENSTVTYAKTGTSILRTGNIVRVIGSDDLYNVNANLRQDIETPILVTDEVFQIV